MLGKLINDFDELSSEKVTLKTFNEMFRTKIEGDTEAEVTIGNYLGAGIREVRIGDKITRVFLKDIVAIKKSHPNKKNMYNIKKEDVLIKSVYTLKDVAEIVGSNTSSLCENLKKGQSSVNGYTIQKLTNIDYTEENNGSN